MMVYKQQTSQHTTNASDSVEDRDSIKLIHEAIAHMKSLAMCNEHMKNLFHYMGLHGFKRLHRHSAREHWEYVMCLGSLLIDHYGICPEYVEHEYKPCSKQGVIENLDTYAKELEKTLVAMNEIKTALVLNNHHYAACYIQEIICCLEKSIKYAYRHLNFAKDVGGSLKDIHWYSHEIHSKFKEKEKSEHNREYV